MAAARRSVDGVDAGKAPRRRVRERALDALDRVDAGVGDVRGRAVVRVPQRARELGVAAARLAQAAELGAPRRRLLIERAGRAPQARRLRSSPSSSPARAPR